jgi:hypothetical protein
MPGNSAPLRPRLDLVPARNDANNSAAPPPSRTTAARGAARTRRSAHEGEATRPADLRVGSQSQLKETESLELSAASQRAHVDRLHPAGPDGLDQDVFSAASSPATRTTVGLGPTDLARKVAAKVVLKALTTRAVGSAAASSLAAELPLGTTRESNVVNPTGS